MKYNYYDIVLQGEDTLSLTYKLENHRPAQVWAELINKRKPEELRPKLNPWRSFDRNVFPTLVDELNDLIDQLNSWIPHKIESKWNTNDNQGSVNRLHIHFPEQEKTETDVNKRAQLSRYNDIIHELEALMVNNTKLFPRLLLCFDQVESVPLELDDYKYFKPRRTFGELCLHYPHVGRHPFELFYANDYNCPTNQILPQKFIAADHTCRFYTDPMLDHYYTPRFKNFYDKSTLKEVIKWDDPKMAFGYITLGKLEGPHNEDDLLKQITDCSKILSWKAY